MRLKSFNERLLRDLQDSEFAAAYLTDAYHDSPEEFLIALRKLVQAHGGMAQVAEKAGVTREALYRMLSEGGNPEFRSLYSILSAVGVSIAFQLAASTTEKKELAAA